MKINQSVGFEHYQSYVNGVKNDANTQKNQLEQRLPSNAESANTDKVVISENAAARAELIRVQANIAAEVENTSSEKIAQLQAQVQDGSYRISSDALADAILGVRA